MNIDGLFRLARRGAIADVYDTLRTLPDDGKDIAPTISGMSQLEAAFGQIYDTLYELTACETEMTLKVEPAEWLRTTTAYKCSYCGNKPLASLDENNPNHVNVELSPYCPWCGAKMDGERREEE